MLQEESSVPMTLQNKSKPLKTWVMGVVSPTLSSVSCGFSNFSFWFLFLFSCYLKWKPCSIASLIDCHLRCLPEKWHHLWACIPFTIPEGTCQHHSACSHPVTSTTWNLCWKCLPPFICHINHYTRIILVHVMYNSCKIPSCIKRSSITSHPSAGRREIYISLYCYL